MTRYLKTCEVPLYKILKTSKWQFIFPGGHEPSSSNLYAKVERVSWTVLQSLCYSNNTNYWCVSWGKKSLSKYIYGIATGQTYLDLKVQRWTWLDQIYTKLHIWAQYTTVIIYVNAMLYICYKRERRNYYPRCFWEYTFIFVCVLRNDFWWHNCSLCELYSVYFIYFIYWFDLPSIDSRYNVYFEGKLSQVWQLLSCVCYSNNRVVCTQTV